MTSPLETERLLLRPKTIADVDAMLAVLGDPVAVRFVGDGVPRTREQVEEGVHRQIEYQETRGFSLWTAVERETGATIGDCGLMPLEGIGPQVEIGYRLARQYWGKGYATEAAGASLAFGFEAAGLDEIVALAYPANGASRRVLEKIGMTCLGPADHYGGTYVKYRVIRPRGTDTGSPSAARTSP